MPEPRRKANLDSWISDEPNASGYYEAKVWMGTKANGKVDRRHVQRKKLADVRQRVKELERQRDAGKVGRAGKAPTVQEMLERHLTTILPAAGRAPRTIEASETAAQTHGLLRARSGFDINEMAAE